MQTTALVRLLVLSMALPLAAQTPPAGAIPPEQATLFFEANRGQLPTGVSLGARGPGYSISLQADRVTLGLRNPDGESAALTMRLLGADAQAEIVGEAPLRGVSHYYRGQDPAAWVTNVPHFARVVGREVYPQIDVVYRGDGKQLEYDFVIAPGATPDAIRIGFDGASNITIDAAGDLVLDVAGGSVVQRAPVLFQDTPDGRHEVTGAFRLDDTGCVSFAVDTWDHRYPLVIDPIIVYSSYFGAGTDASFSAIAAATDGSVVTAGGISTGTLPAAVGTPSGSGDAFFSRFDAAGSLLSSVYFGGAGDDYAAGIAIDGNGWVWLAGSTTSADMPVTQNAHDETFGGGADAFLAGFDPTGLLGYATYLGGPESDGAGAVATGPGNSVYVTGTTTDSGATFPTTSGAFSATNVSIAAGLSEVFVARFAPIGGGASDLTYATLIGAGGGDFVSSIAVDAAGLAYITGDTFTEPSRRPYWPTTSNAYRSSIRAKRNVFLDTAYVSVIAPNGNGSADLVYSTFLFPKQGSELGTGIAVDDFGRAYVSGICGSNLETTAGSFDPDFNGGNQLSYIDSFALVLDTTIAGSAGLVYSTYLGGYFTDRASAIVTTSATAGAPGTMHVAGYTHWGTAPSNESVPILPFPTTPGAVQSAHLGRFDGFYSRLLPAGNGAADLEYSTMLGGSGEDTTRAMAVGPTGLVHLVGSTGSTDFLAPNTTGPAAGAWITALDVGQLPSPPAAPSNLTAQAVSTSQIDLAWTDNSGDENGFRIERSPDGSSWSLLLTTGPNVVSHADTGLAAASTWSYRVRAFNLDGDSAWSNSATATTTGGGGSNSSAASDIPVKGTVVGSFVDTHTDDGVVEAITEGESGGKPTNRYSTLEHKWTFNVSSGVTFEINAWCTSLGDNDAFAFEWSADNQNWSPLLTVSSTDPANVQTGSFGSAVSGTIYIRVTDTDSTPGTRGLKDTLSVDHMVIRP